jgi:hypothetical protein
MDYFRREGAKGGKLSAKARMEKMTPAQRSAIAKNAVAARWAKADKAKSDPTVKATKRKKPTKGE